MKKLTAVFLALCITLCLYPVSAQNPNHFVEVYGYTGKLYYCDHLTDRVVLRELNHGTKNFNANSMARQAEYNEIKIFENAVRMADNSKLLVKDLNLYVDSLVYVIVAKKADGSFVVPYLKFK